MNDQRTNPDGGEVKYRKLRFTWSAICGVLCLLLFALWVRSYSWMDAVPRLNMASARGEFYANQNLQIQPGGKDDRVRYGIISMSLDGQKVVRVGRPGLVVPFWVIALFLIAFSLGPQLRPFRQYARPENS